MAVQYYNGQLYDVQNAQPFMGMGTNAPSMTNLGAIINPNAWKDYSYVKGLGFSKPISAPSGSNSNQGSGANGNPFASASSGGVSGTLQPFVNRNTSLANNALYGGLLGYQPQQLMAGNAGGTPVSPQPPQYNMPSAFPQGLLSFGNRSWMGGQ